MRPFPRRRASVTRARARCVLPVPVGPTRKSGLAPAWRSSATASEASRASALAAPTTNVSNVVGSESWAGAAGVGPVAGRTRIGRRSSLGAGPADDGGLRRQRRVRGGGRLEHAGVDGARREPGRRLPARARRAHCRIGRDIPEGGARLRSGLALDVDPYPDRAVREFARHGPDRLDEACADPVAVERVGREQVDRALGVHDGLVDGQRENPRIESEVGQIGTEATQHVVPYRGGGGASGYRGEVAKERGLEGIWGGSTRFALVSPLRRGGVEHVVREFAMNRRRDWPERATPRRFNRNSRSLPRKPLFACWNSTWIQGVPASLRGPIERHADVSRAHSDTIRDLVKSTKICQKQEISRKF